ncbi:MAG TPA: dihydrofolate reductase [Candidatus Egerieimonas intestinavium]|uniref:Dihydrofolate reductase n=1 Tax=Candidatus Egerieimonas intestinavium TaxID=2840777 RepID=A0A9D1EL60_9FIRM|nr:dihydrofolate reductase [Candidatus Egerieimonas intestinavium]
MKAIVAADKNWAIGKGNDLLVKIPMDQKFFRQETSGHVVVMGRKTLESFPGGMPLKNRTNIVLTRRQDYDGKGALVVHSLEELLEELKKYPEDEIYVVGGGQIYELLLPYCNLIHVTKINFAYEADTYFPNLDQLPEWEVTASSEEQTYFDLEFEFLQYERKA